MWEIIMGENEQMFIIFIIIALLGFLVIKLWSLFWNKIHKANKKYFHEKSGLEEFYFSIYFILFLFSSGIIYAYTALNYKIGYYVFILLGISIVLSFLMYKKLNPTLTKIISNEGIFAQSKFFGKYRSLRTLYIYYYFNTFYLFSIIINTITVIIV